VKAVAKGRGLGVGEMPQNFDKEKKAVATVFSVKLQEAAVGSSKYDF